jgi:hypothetical protein
MIRSLSAVMRVGASRGPLLGRRDRCRCRDLHGRPFRYQPARAGLAPSGQMSPSSVLNSGLINRLDRPTTSARAVAGARVSCVLFQVDLGSGKSCSKIAWTAGIASENIPKGGPLRCQRLKTRRPNYDYEISK